MLKNKKILVTGSNGQLGKTLQKNRWIKIVLSGYFLTKEKLDITKISEIQSEFKNTIRVFVLIVLHCRCN